jgi:hypothetical protein
MPNSEPSTEDVTIDVKYGSRQKRMDNFTELVNFLHDWKKSQTSPSMIQGIKVAERFCDVHFQYGHVSKKDITQQALMKVNLL